MKWMTMSWRIVLGLLLSGVACSKSSEDTAAQQAAEQICSHRWKCENAEQPTPERIEECKAHLTDEACGAAARRLQLCINAYESCTPEGQLDMKVMLAACSELSAAHLACVVERTKRSNAP